MNKNTYKAILGWITSTCNICGEDMSRPHPKGKTETRLGETCKPCTKRLQELAQQYRDANPNWDDD